MMAVEGTLIALALPVLFWPGGATFALGLERAVLHGYANMDVLIAWARRPPG
jgi:cation transport ATPase